MVEHICLFVCKPETSREKLNEIIEAFQGLKGVIPGLLEVSIGINDTDELEFKKATLGMRMLFDNRDCLRSYLNHPEHVLAAGVLLPVISEISVCDFERKD